jgi:hypothetical protein
MEGQRPGERQCFPHVTGEPLTDRVMPALDRSQLARWLVHGAVGRPGEDGSIGRPEVAIASTTSIGFRDGFPKPPTGGFRRRPRPVETFRSFRPTELPGRPLPRPGVGSRLPGEDRPDEDPIQPRPSPQADPLRIGPQNLLLLRFRIPHLGFQDPIGPTGLAGVLRVPVSIPSVLDNVHTPASTAPVSPGLRNPGTPPREDSLYDTSLPRNKCEVQSDPLHRSTPTVPDPFLLHRPVTRRPVPPGTVPPRQPCLLPRGLRPYAGTFR